MTITELKAQAYDVLSTIEQLQQRLQQINGLITAEIKKESIKLPVEAPKNETKNKKA